LPSRPRLVLIGFVACLLMLAFAAQLAAAAERYASPTPDATPGAGCPQEDPCDLETAVEDAATDDEVILLPSASDYVVPNNDQFVIPGGVEVHGQDGQPRPSVVGNGFFAPLTGVGSNVTIRHLRIQNTGPALELQQGLLVRDVIARSTSDGFFACVWFGSGTITDSVCWASGTNSVGAGAAQNATPITATLRNVTAISSSVGLSFTVSNSSGPSTADAKNVIASGATDVWASADGATSSMTVTLSHSNYDTTFAHGSNGATASVTDPATNNNQMQLPLFVDAGNGDFHQAATSPTIDAGTTDPANGPVDIDGDSRLHGSAPDIGADEFNTQPVAVDDSPSLPEDSATTSLGVLANDTDGEGDAITVESKTDPSHGTATISSGGTGIEYQPNPNYCGSDSLTYAINGGDTATVNISVTCVDDAPVAVADSATVAQDSGSTAIGVLGNDTDIDAGPKAVASATAPPHGTAAVDAGGSGVSYQPAAGYCGPDSFSYTLNGGSSATVSVTVTCAPPPVDDLAPGTSFLKKPPKVTRKRRAKFRFASTEAGSTFLCKLDRKPFRPCRSPATFTVRPGKHRLRVKAIDIAGNVDATPASYRWKVLPPP
jgi:hypothetical protein